MNNNDKTRLIPRQAPAAEERPTVRIKNIPIQPLFEDNGKTVLVPRSSLGQTPEPPSSNDERTRLIRISSSSKNSQDEASEPAADSSEIGWVVGWIVAICGPMKGMSFSLGVGQNKIGRDASNRICLKDDNGISRNGHLVITYDPRRNRFSARPGSEGSGITDLNDELLEMPSALKRGDILRLTDDTSLRFIPMCDEEFTWS